MATEVKTKEEILEGYIEPRKINGEWEFDPTKEDAIKAMNEYAKQESIGFRKWCQTSAPSVLGGKTVEQLYDIYKSITP